MLLDRGAVVRSFRIVLLTACVAGFLTQPATSQSLAGAQTVSTAGQWELLFQIDGFTGAPTCVVVYAGRPEIQVYADTFFISYAGRGGIEAYNYRLGEMAPAGLQLATDIERDLGAIIFDGAVFQRILAADRLRVEALMLVAGMAQEDLDLAGLTEMIAEMAVRCSDDAASTAKPGAVVKN